MPCILDLPSRSTTRRTTSQRHRRSRKSRQHPKRWWLRHLLQIQESGRSQFPPRLSVRLVVYLPALWTRAPTANASHACRPAPAAGAGAAAGGMKYALAPSCECSVGARARGGATRGGSSQYSKLQPEHTHKRHLSLSAAIWNAEEQGQRNGRDFRKGGPSERLGLSDFGFARVFLRLKISQEPAGARPREEGGG